MNSPELNFRSATHADVDAIVVLVESAYRGDVSRKGWTTEADLLDGQRIDRTLLVDLIGRDDARVILAERDGQLLGCCELQNLHGSGYFGMFSVNPDAQGAGIGDRLLREAERFALEQWECSTMRMTVIDIRSELIAWYLRRGYQRTGEHRPFPYGDERFGIPRRADLRFEVLSKPLN